MELYALLNDVDCEVVGSAKIEIENLSMNSKKVVKNTLFFCISGTKTNGKIYLKEAIKNGAVAIICDKCIHTELNITQIIVKNVRIAMAQICANFYNNPQKKLKIVGITGTNGKSSTAYFTYQILKNMNKKVGLIGTSGVYFDDEFLDLNMTTPESIDLFKIFAKMVDKKIEYCIMEVSAHAIYFDKIYGVDFSVKALTNIQVDHLDFFKTKQNYVETKLKFFKPSDKIVCNADDIFSKRINKINKKVLFFGKKSRDFLIKNINCTLSSTYFELDFLGVTHKIKSRVIGGFNVENLACAIGILYKLGFEIENIENNLTEIKNFAGRLDVVYNAEFNVIVDYAHTLDSLENLFKGVKEISDNKNIVVFGAPGERDTTKRFLMGKLASQYADIIILTTDNPASENPLRIIFEIEQGVISANRKSQYYIVEDREKAIKKALQLAKKKKNTNVLVVGKGVETYQIVGDKHLPYSDYDVINRTLKII